MQSEEIDRGTVAAVDAQEVESEALSAVAAAETVDEIEQARVEYLGRKSAAQARAAGGAGPRDGHDAERAPGADRVGDRRARGGASPRRARPAADRGARRRDHAGEAALRGHLHLITQIRREFEDIFLGLGYTVVDGREVETTRYNFDALNFPEGHPSRSPLQTLFLDDETVLRTETSPSQIRTMETQEPPVYIVSLGRVYRRDTPDATHTPTFHQAEGLAVDEGITLGDLLGTLDYLCKALFGENRKTEFRIHHFPFTEPSVEAYVSCHVCDGSGCPVCRHSGWIEVGGSGMVDPNLFEFVGYDPERYTGFAFGWGLERIAVLRHGIPDLRELWRNDPRLLGQF